MEKLDYWQKNPDLKSFEDLTWNIPEQKSGSVNIIGGNAQNFSSVIHAAEYLAKSYPIKSLRIIMPDALKSKLPPLDNLFFTASTEAGSFAKSKELEELLNNTDFNILVGEFSKNSATTIAVSDALKSSSSPYIVIRDGVDLIIPEMDSILEKDSGFIVASMAQLQKLFRAIYYPKMLLLSMPLMQAVETLHKFTLSFNVTILTFHQEKIIVASAGKVATLPLDSTSYTPLTLWSGELACKIAAMNLYNPKKQIEATLSALRNDWH